MHRKSAQAVSGADREVLRPVSFGGGSPSVRGDGWRSRSSARIGAGRSFISAMIAALCAARASIPCRRSLRLKPLATAGFPGTRPGKSQVARASLAIRWTWRTGENCARSLLQDEDSPGTARGCLCGNETVLNLPVPVRGSGTRWSALFESAGETARERRGAPVPREPASSLAARSVFPGSTRQQYPPPEMVARSPPLSGPCSTASTRPGRCSPGRSGPGWASGPACGRPKAWPARGSSLLRPAVGTTYSGRPAVAAKRRRALSGCPCRTAG